MSPAFKQKKPFRITYAKALMIFFFSLQGASAHAQDALSEKQQALEHSFISRQTADEESPARDKWQKPEKVIEALGIKEGDRIAHIGARSGSFTFRLADKVGKAGTIYAVDKEQEWLDYITKKMKQHGVTNIIPVHASNVEPMLPASCCDLILMVHSYGLLFHPVEFMRNARRALKPGGQVAIIGKKESGAGNIRSLRPDLTAPTNEVVVQMESIGYKLVMQYDFLQQQYFLLFQ